MEAVMWLEHAAAPMLVLAALVAVLMMGHKLKTYGREFLVPELEALIERLDKHEAACISAQEQTRTELAKLTATINAMSADQTKASDSSQRARKELHEKIDALSDRVSRVEQKLTKKTRKE